MNDERLQTAEQVKQFLAGSEALDFGGVSVEERYQWIQTVLVRFKHYQLKRAEKEVIRRYIEKVSGYSQAQVSSLIREYNLRRSHLYRSITKRYTRTKPTVVRIGERARPASGGSPGYIRIAFVRIIRGEGK
jgi:hypothetical protein